MEGCHSSLKIKKWERALNLLTVLQRMYQSKYLMESELNYVGVTLGKIITLKQHY